MIHTGSDDSRVFDSSMTAVAIFPCKTESFCRVLNARKIGVHKPKTLCAELFEHMGGAAAYFGLEERENQRNARQGRQAQGKTEGKEGEEEASIFRNVHAESSI